MRYLGVLVIVVASFFVVTAALAGEAVFDLSTAHGMVEKADKDAVTLQMRTASGKFGKKLSLKITGTSKLTMVTKEKRGGKMVPVQRDVEAKDLEPNQHIAVIYVGGADPVLLSAVLQRASAK